MLTESRDELVQIVEFMVPLCCGKCEEKVKEELENVRGKQFLSLITPHAGRHNFRMNQLVEVRVHA